MSHYEKTKEVKKMKVCVPTSDAGGMEDQVSHHFGHSPTFTVVDTDTGETKVIENGAHGSGTCAPTERIRDSGATVVVCSGLGANAMSALRARGIEVFVGATGSARTAVEQFKGGQVEDGRSGIRLPATSARRWATHVSSLIIQCPHLGFLEDQARTGKPFSL